MTLAPDVLLLLAGGFGSQNGRHMSYKKMEATLIEKVQELKDMETELMRAYIQLQCNPSAAATAAVNQGFESVDRQVSVIERLMAHMDRVSPVAPEPVFNTVLSPAYMV
jgi:hypothetical protein